MSKYDEAMQAMTKQFGQDTFLSLATMDGSRPAVRVVNSYYEDGSFYVVTYTLSNKMKQIKANPEVTVFCGDWFTPFIAHGFGENLGWVRDESNAAVMTRVREAFFRWYDNGHVAESDKNTCLLRIRLTDGVLPDDGKEYKIDFAHRTA